MTFDPRAIGYPIPYQPLFESTRQEIERSLSVLEEKLKRRKEIDLEMQLRNEAELSRPTPFIQNNYYEALRHAQETQRAHRFNVEDQIRLQQIADDQYLTRLQQLRLERDQLVRQTALAKSIGTHPLPAPLPVYNLSSPSDDELISKYENGTKAKEYYQDLQMQLKRKEQSEIRNVQIANEKKYGGDNEYRPKLDGNHSKTDRKTKQTYQVNKEYQRPVQFTPYDFLRQPEKSNKDQIASNTKKISPKLARQLQKQFDQVPQKHFQSAAKLPSAKQLIFRTSSPLRILNEPSDQGKLSPYRRNMHHYKSLGKMPCNRSRSNISPNRASNIDNSYLNSKLTKTQAKPSVQEIELNAIKKIQNRLKVSKVIYQDAKFRNSKYEENHLFNTFEIESKCRRQIKDRINAHPFILRKHAMVID